MASIQTESEATQPSTPTGEKVSNPSSPLDRESTLLAVRKQVEYYFSKENLLSDVYLTSQMDASNSVSIAVVMRFSKMKTLLNGDESLLREALKDSTICPVSVDGRIKASFKLGGRSTIILREIAADTPETAVRDIFNFDGCKRIVSIRSDIENTWFVEMESETDAKDTLLDLKLKRRMFNGENVKARLKTEVAVRSFYSQTQPIGVPVGGGMLAYPGMTNMSGMPISPYGSGFAGNGSPNGGNVMQAGTGVFSYGMQTVDPNLIAGNAQMIINPDGTRGGMQSYGTMPYKQDGNNFSTEGHGRDHMKHARGKAGENDRVSGVGRTGPSTGSAGVVSGRGGDRSGQASPPYPPVQNNGGRGGNPLPKATGSPTGAVRSNATDARAGTGGARQPKGKGPQNKVPASGGQIPIPVDLTLQNFPPLHVDETPVPAAGFSGNYQKYTADEIIAIVSNIRDAPLPISAQDGRPLKVSDHPHALAIAPNNDLLKRQRSFSIDETREQLQQGRPVQREAVASGAVDYHSMYFGDERSASIDESGLVNGLALSAAMQAETVSREGSNPGSANRSRSNSDNYQTKVNITQSSVTGRTSVNSQSQPRGTNAVPSASSWAQVVTSGANVSTQTDSKLPASPPRAGVVTATSKPAAAAKSDAKISKDSGNTKGTSASSAGAKGSTEGRSRSGSSGSMGGKDSGKGRSQQQHKKKDNKVRFELYLNML